MTSPTSADVTLPHVAPASPVRQMRSLAGAEWRLLTRNKVALMNTLLMPGLLVLLFAGLPGASDLGLGETAPVLILGMALVFVVYYTLVTALVARREAGVLQRLRTGEAGDATILAGLALPFALITLVETVLCVLGSVLVLDAGSPVNPVLLVAATVGGTLVWTLLGAASTGITRSVEHAQITTMPLIFVALLGSGLSIPLSILPETLRTVASLTPMAPVVDLMQLGMTGLDTDGAQLDLAGTFAAAGRPLLVLLVWGVLAAWAARRYLRWSPRG